MTLRGPGGGGGGGGGGVSVIMTLIFSQIVRMLPLTALIKTGSDANLLCAFFEQGVAPDITTCVILAGFSSLELERILKTMTLYDTQQDTQPTLTPTSRKTGHLVAFHDGDTIASQAKHWQVRWSHA